MANDSGLDVPDGWRSATVAELALSCVGGPFGSDLTSKHYVSAGVPVIRGSNLSGTSQWMSEEGFVFVSEEKADELSRNLAFPGDLVFTQRGTLGQVAQIRPMSPTRRYLLSQSQMKLTVDESMADPTFVYQFFVSPTALRRIEKSTIATGLPHINLGILRGFHVPIPPLPEQRKIAAILSSVDEAINKTQAVIDQLAVVKKAMMQDLLAKGLPGRHTRFKKTEIGMVPESWEVAPLYSVAQVQTGIAKGKAIVGGIELPYLRVANVQDGYVDLGEVKTIVVAQASIERYQLQTGDVLFTEGGDADKLGRGCVWKGEIDPCLHQNHVFAVRSDDSTLAPEFLAAWAASPRGKAYFMDCAKQTTNLASINSTQLKAFPVPIPDPDEQSAIVDALASVGRRQDAERATLASLHATKSAIMSVLLTGEVRVTPDEDAA